MNDELLERLLCVMMIANDISPQQVEEELERFRMNKSNRD